MVNSLEQELTTLLLEARSRHSGNLIQVIIARYGMFLSENDFRKRDSQLQDLIGFIRGNCHNFHLSVRSINFDY